RADLPARIAAGAFLRIDDVPCVGRHGNGIDRAALRAKSATGAVLDDSILDQRGAFASRTASLQVRLIFIPKITECGQHRIGRGFSETAKTAGSHLIGQAFQFGQVSWLAFSSAESFEDLEHAPRADAAKGAFAAGLFLGEIEKVAGNIDHA